MFNLIVEAESNAPLTAIGAGVVYEQWAKNPAGSIHASWLVIDDGGQPEVAVGWTYAPGATPAFVAPAAPAPSKAQLLSYAEHKVDDLLHRSRNYIVAGLSGPIYEDFDIGTSASLSQIAQCLSLSSLVFPFLYSDENYEVWSLTQVQLSSFLSQIFAYGASVWAFCNGTAIPAIQAGSITTVAEIDGLAWPT